MTVSTAIRPQRPPSLARPAPVFTLGSTLGWLGHDCPGHCSAPIDELSASIWFIRHGPTLHAMPRGALVLVDPDDGLQPRDELGGLIRAISACTNDDGIRVREQHAGDNGHAHPNVLT